MLRFSQNNIDSENNIKYNEKKRRGNCESNT